MALGENINNIKSFTELSDAMQKDMNSIQHNIIDNVDLMKSIADGSNIATPSETVEYLSLN